VFQGVTDIGDTTAAQVFAATVDIDPGAGVVLAGVLADNGGPVQTIALKHDLSNPALDRSDNTAPANDARGAARFDWLGITNSNGSAADLGAFELQNAAPVIISNGGGSAAMLIVAENGAPVTTVVATDADATVPSYSIAGGADAALFTIDAATGALAFKAAPDFETPQDAGADNVYEVIVGAFDGGTFDTQVLSVEVTDIAGVSILGSGEDDLIDAGHTLPGRPFPGNEGDDLRGKGGDDTITGGSGDDTIMGGNGDDRLAGGDGDDVFFGGRGENVYTGGLGDDSFVLARKAAFGRITDYEAGEIIQLAENKFPGIGPKGVLKAKYFHVGSEAETTDQHILYDANTGLVLYARHGSDTADPRAFLKIGKGLSDLDAGDFMVI
jgi:Ca2+-binding RTX toxin-like protein